VPSVYDVLIGVEAGEFEAVGEPSIMLSLEELRPKTGGAEVELGDG
jgi:hypothetical protein